MGTGCFCANQKKNQSKGQTVPSALLCTKSTNDENDKELRWKKALAEFSYFNDPINQFRRANPEKFKKLLLGGPPKSLRWEVWKNMLECPGKLVKNWEIDSEFLSLIEKDLERTFPFHDFFQDPGNLSSLRKVLIGVACLNPDLGYCQGMNYVAGVLLLTSNGSIPESIAMFDLILNKLNAKGLFEIDFPKVQELTTEFTKVFQVKSQTLYSHFCEVELDEHLWITKWFMTIFTYSFRMDVVIRIWDLLFACGLDIMVYVAIEILQGIDKSIENKDLVEILEVFADLRVATIDIEKVILGVLSYAELKNYETDWKDTNSDEADARFHLDFDSVNRSAEKPRPIIFVNIDKKSRPGSLVIQHSPRS